MAKNKFKWDNRGYNVFREQAEVKAMNNTAFQLLNEISDSNVVPLDTGELQEKKSRVMKAKLNKKNAGIIWFGPYARRLFFHPEYNFKNGRKGRWTDDWVTGNKKQRILEIYKKALKKVMK